MSMKLYVGSLPYSTTDEELSQLFSEKGAVVSATVIKDRDSGQSKGFGFVEMENDEEAKEAIKTMNGTDLGGRSIVVSEARPMENRRPRDNRGGDRGNYRPRY